MSGFAVVVRRDGGPVPVEIGDRILQSMSHRGPDGLTRHDTGRITLLHAALHTTPESVVEDQPYRHPSGTWYVGDIRLDNRAELLASLGWRRTPADTSDIELVAEAHQRWGELAASRLLGDFAFAAVEESGRVECYRDHLGIKPVHYWRNDKWLVVSSELRQVVAHPELRPRLNVALAGEYLSGHVEDPVETIIEGVRRLPAASGMVADQTIRVWRYWWADLDRPLVRSSRQAYEEEFRELFEEAVRCRLRSCGPIATHLSGGLDSTSIAAMAASMTDDVRTYSLLFPESQRADERPFIDAAVSALGLDWDEVVNDPLRDPWVNDDVAFWSDIPLPPDGPNHVELCRRVSDRGGRVLLSGHGGDNWFDADSSVLADLVGSGRLTDAWRVAAGFEGGNRRATFETLLRSGLIPHKPSWIRRRGARRAGWVIGPARSAASLDQRRIPGRLPKRYRSRAAQIIYEGDAGGYEAMTRLVFDRIGARGGVEIRHPYLDRRLMEFACRIPSVVHAEHGRNRSLQRDSLADLLPAEVANRQSKASFRDVWWREIQRHLPSNRLETSAVVRAGWVDLGEATAAMEQTRVAMEERYSGTGSLIGMWGVVQVEALLHLHGDPGPS